MRRQRSGATVFALSERARQSLRRSLLAWFDRTKRDLPWRRTHDPYRIWLSECMLQQTRVETVVPYYERFLNTLPTIDSLAAAPLQRVLKLWAGLGYYARARHLHRAAQTIVREHRGQVPKSAAELSTLPGVGKYTAAAVASIAFGEPAAAVDGNVQRVLARLFAVDLPIDAPSTRAQLWSLAEGLLDHARPGAFNEAMMELGATLCTPTTPRCSDCPLSNWCTAHRDARTAELPIRSRRAAPAACYVEAVGVRRQGRLLLIQRQPRGLFGGMWELPGIVSVAHAAEPIAAPRLVKHVLDHHRVSIDALHPIGIVTHVLTHRRMMVRVWVAAARGGRAYRGSHASVRWLAHAARSDLPISVLDRKVIDLAEGRT
ncbi:MAG: A/G-specific adenine glycosylase [Planctomycetia bacterium]|nr:MAG: A/G-specific adenine glycosylase [Planctomycetia bacterium]